MKGRAKILEFHGTFSPVQHPLEMFRERQWRGVVFHSPHASSELWLSILSLIRAPVQ